MKALLLAAGLGVRLRPLTNDIPKCLVPIHGKPLLEYWFHLLSVAGVGPLLVNLHYFHEKVEAFVKTSSFRSKVVTVYEKELLGTAGTVLKNRDFFGNEEFMLIHADNLSKFDVKAFIRCHHERPQGCEITMMTYETPAPETCGIVELDNRGVVVAFHEKSSEPYGNLANGAVYIMEPSVVDFLNSMGQDVIDLSTQVIPRYMGRIFTFYNDIYHRDIGTIESYRQAEKEFKG